MVSPYIADVSEQTFDALVLQKSREVPVLVDFWAAWCAPCQMLMPILAKLAAEYDGKFFLAKVDTDAEQRLAGQHGIRGLPTVRLYRNGQVVHEFTGAQPERAIRAILDKHLPRESDTLVDQALAAHEAGRTEAAIAGLNHAVEADPANDRARLKLGQLLFAQGRFDEGEALLNGLSREARDLPETSTLLARLEFARLAGNAPPEPELERRVAQDPGDSDARYRLSAHYVLREAYEPAMQQLLEIVRRDRKFGDDAGRKALLTVFNLLGGKGELVNRYRSLLSTALNF